MKLARRLVTSDRGGPPAALPPTGLLTAILVLLALRGKVFDRFEGSRHWSERKSRLGSLEKAGSVGCLETDNFRS
jgi:hypothetical protein